MTPAEFRAALDAAGLRQVDFVRLVCTLSGQPADAGTINRWATGKRPVPALAIVVLALWRRLPEDERRQILGDGK